MEGFLQDGLLIEFELIQADLLVGESIEVSVRYINASDRAIVLELPDPDIPSTFDLEFSVRNERGDQLATINPETLPETFVYLHAEPAEVTISPGDTVTTSLNLTKLLPEFAPGSYAIVPFSSFGESKPSSILEFHIRPIGIIENVVSVQDRPITGINSAYVMNADGVRSLFLEQTLNFAGEDKSAGDGEVAFRRRLKPATLDIANPTQIHLSRKTVSAGTTRHIVVVGDTGNSAVVTITDDRTAIASPVRINGRILTKSLYSNAAGELIFASKEDATLHVYRYVSGALAHWGSMDGVELGTYQVFESEGAIYLFYLNLAGTSLRVMDLAGSSLRLLELYTFAEPMGNFAVVAVPYRDSSSILLLPLPVERSEIDGIMARVILWSSQDDLIVDSAEHFSEHLQTVVFAAPHDDGIAITFLGGGRYITTVMSGIPSDHIMVIRSLSGKEIVFGRTSGWLTRLR